MSSSNKNTTPAPVQSRVLIVDDQSLMRNHMHRLLRDEGYELNQAANGQEALAKINDWRPDLVLLDVRMPQVDGFEVCRRVRENPRTADIPIIMVTAFDDRAARMKGIEVGADDFIPKPYDSLELQARVRTITRLNRYRRISNERAKFQLIAELSEHGYVLINQNGHCTYANRQARIFLGLPTESEAAVIEEPFLTLCRRSYRLESEASWREWPQQTSHQQPRYLIRPESAHNSGLWLRVDIHDQLPDNNEMVRVVNIQDVTEQMMAKHDMWKFQRAIHHKMRTPLIGMYSGIQFLATYAGEMDRSDLQQLLDTALEHGERLRSAVEDVLKYVDMPSYARAGNKFPVRSLPRITKRICKELEVEAVSVRGSREAIERLLVLSEESMEVILGELIENAQKFHPQKSPEVEVTARTAQNDMVNITVIDNGRHLTPSQRDRVWEPYYQSEKSFTGEVAGMGLGLSTVSTLIWSVGGKCHIENRTDTEGIKIQLFIPSSTEQFDDS